MIARTISISRCTLRVTSSRLNPTTYPLRKLMSGISNHSLPARPTNTNPTSTTTATAPPVPVSSVLPSRPVFALPPRPVGAPAPVIKPSTNPRALHARSPSPPSLRRRLRSLSPGPRYRDRYIRSPSPLPLRRDTRVYRPRSRSISPVGKFETRDNRLASLSPSPSPPRRRLSIRRRDFDSRSPVRRRRSIDSRSPSPRRSRRRSIVSRSPVKRRRELSRDSTRSIVSDRRTKKKVQRVKQEKFEEAWGDYTGKEKPLSERLGAVVEDNKALLGDQSS
jgi:hypothetical protein